MEDYNFDEFDYATLTPDEIKEFFVDFCDDNELYVGGGEGSVIHFYTSLIGDITNRHPGSLSNKVEKPRINRYDQSSPAAIRAFADSLERYDNANESYIEQRDKLVETLALLRKTLFEIIEEDAGVSDVPCQFREKVIRLAKSHHGDNFYEYYSFLIDLVNIFR